MALPASCVRAWVLLKALTESKLAVMLHWFWKPLQQQREGDGQTGHHSGGWQVILGLQVSSAECRF